MTKKKPKVEDLALKLARVRAGGAAIDLINHYLESQGGFRAGFMWEKAESKLLLKITATITKAYETGRREGRKAKKP